MIKQKGIASGLMLVMMAVAFVGLLGASAMVKKNQDTRNRAADYECQSSSECADGYVCKNFYCVKSGQPAPKCKEGDVQRCQINGRAGQKECTGGKWSQCVETSSEAQDKCGMTAAQLKKAAADCRASGMRWVAPCDCKPIKPTPVVTQGNYGCGECKPREICKDGVCSCITIGCEWADDFNKFSCTLRGCTWNDLASPHCTCGGVN